MKGGVILKVVLFWTLTLFYGVAGIVYLLMSSIFSKSTESSARVEQPNCLSDLEYGRHKFLKRKADSVWNELPKSMRDSSSFNLFKPFSTKYLLRKPKGVKLHYVEAGERGNPVVILIHGAPGFWFCWRKQIPVLAEKFFVVSLDLRGCGDSDNSTLLTKTSYLDIIEDIKELYRVLGIASANIVCNETSGILGWHLATTNPQMVTRMVFLNSPHPYITRVLFHFSIRRYIKMWYLLLLQIPILPELLLNRYYNDMKKNLEGSMKKMSMTDEEIQAYMYNFSRKEDWIGFLELIRHIDIRPIIKPIELETIQCNILLLMGTQYPYVPAEAAYRSAEFVERIKITPIDGGDCRMQVTHSSKINEELSKFFVRTSSLPDVIKPNRHSLVGRVIGAVKNPYTMIASGEFFFDKFGSS